VVNQCRNLAAGLAEGLHREVNAALLAEDEAEQARLLGQAERARVPKEATADALGTVRATSTTDSGMSENQAAHDGFVSSRGATTSPACHSSTFQLKM
jgi:hypothetical protein